MRIRHSNPNEKFRSLFISRVFRRFFLLEVREAEGVGKSVIVQKFLYIKIFRRFYVQLVTKMRVTSFLLESQFPISPSRADKAHRKKRRSGSFRSCVLLALITVFATP